MTIGGVAMTARMAAAGRALESRRPDRLFDDPLAQPLAGEEGFRWMQEMRPPGAPAENPSIGPRTWFFDQLITRAAGDGFGQVVLLAAGMDSRAFRLPLPAGTVVYELDDPAVLAGKQAILDREQAVPCCARRPVAADLVGTRWPAALAAAGFDPAAPAVFVAEGLTWYLPGQVVALLLDQAAGIAAPGSRLGVDMISADALASPAAAPVLRPGRGRRRPLAVRHQRPGRLPGRPRLAGRHPRHVRGSPQPGPVATTGHTRRHSRPGSRRQPELVHQRHPGPVNRPGQGRRQHPAARRRSRLLPVGFDWARGPRRA